MGTYAMRRPRGVFRPEQAAAGLGMQYNVGSGVFRNPQDDGGGIFNRSISGQGQIPEGTKIAYFLGGVVVAGVLTYWGLKRFG